MIYSLEVPNGYLVSEFNGYSLEIDMIEDDINLGKGETSIFESSGDLINFVNPTALLVFHDQIRLSFVNLS